MMEYEYVHSGLIKKIEKNSNEELEKTINEYYPHLLES